MDVILNSFNPLCCTKEGRIASEVHDLPPFIDGSCRREPDFEKEFPAITGLCRTDKLVPRLNVSDLIIYITNKKRFYTSKKERRLVAVLEVVDLIDSHQAASEWYQQHNSSISQNIFCNETQPFSADFTHEQADRSVYVNGKVNIDLWNGGYRKRMRTYPKVAITQVWAKHLYLNNPSEISDETMFEVFNRIPRTQNPPYLSATEWDLFQNLILQKI